MIYTVFGYRKRVTRNNLKNSFPKKTAEDLAKIEVLFYRHFADIVVETVKSFTISEASLRKRMKLVNPEFLEKMYNAKISLIAVTGHYGNWEWAALSLPLQSKFTPQGIYRPLKNKVFNRSMIHSRSRFGLKLISSEFIAQEFEAMIKNPTITGFIADQSPSNPKKSVWVDFLNQETPVAYGTEKYARSCKLGVAFGKINKIKRGFYTLEYELVTDKPEQLPDGAITEIHSEILERCIQSNPQYWLWTHKRWKHKRPEGINLNKMRIDERLAE